MVRDYDRDIGLSIVVTVDVDRHHLTIWVPSDELSYKTWSLFHFFTKKIALLCLRHELMNHRTERLLSRLIRLR